MYMFNALRIKPMEVYAKEEIVAVYYIMLVGDVAARELLDNVSRFSYLSSKMNWINVALENCWFNMQALDTNTHTHIHICIHFESAADVIPYYNLPEFETSRNHTNWDAFESGMGGTFPSGCEKCFPRITLTVQSRMHKTLPLLVKGVYLNTYAEKQGKSSINNNMRGEISGISKITHANRRCVQFAHFECHVDRSGIGYNDMLDVVWNHPNIC